jgi:hypothetical protein
MLMKEFLINLTSIPNMLSIGYQIISDKLKLENYRRQTL